VTGPLDVVFGDAGQREVGADQRRVGANHDSRDEVFADYNAASVGICVRATSAIDQP
jgi:hypothetical protein